MPSQKRQLFLEENLKRSLILALLAIGVSSAFAQNLYSNQSSNVNVAQLNAVATSGSGVAAPTGGYWSECQTDGSGFANTSAGYTIIGPTFRIADDFTVGAGGWAVTGLKVYAYQTGSTGNPYTGGNLNIWNGRPGDAGMSIIGTGTWTGGTDSIRINAGGTMGNIFRIFNTTTPPPGTAPGTTRRLWEQTFSLSMNLAAGTYWVDYQLTGPASGFAPTSTHQGLRGPAGANARQFTGSWVDITDTGNPVGGPAVAQDMPFIITGTVPEPGTMAVLGIGALALLRRRKKA
jgi:hypothetical protein